MAIGMRDYFIGLGFEGLVIREKSAEYQFGGRRNNSMLKFKKKEDGLFEIIDIVPEGVKRANLGKFVLRNDINDELFECTYNASHSAQEEILINKSKYIGKKVLVEYRERSGVNQLPFHAKAVKIKSDFSLCKDDWLYLIPTIKITKSNRYLEVELDVLLLSIYWVFSIGNYDKDES